MKQSKKKKAPAKPRKPREPNKPDSPMYGNKFWELRSKHGRDKLFATPELLWEAATEYFNWCVENPLYEKKAFVSQGVVITQDLPHMRALTIRGLCLYMGCNVDYLNAFKKTCNKDFYDVITRIEDYIYNSKFEGAAADMLNPNIIARELKLKDSTDVTSNDETITGKMIIELIDSREQVRLEESEEAEFKELNEHEPDETENDK